LRIERFDIDGPVLITPRVLTDVRGSFVEAYSRRAFDDAIGAVEFVQENQSLSRKRGTVRGLHLQTSPRAQSKLIRVIKGVIFDVALDLRPGSPTYRKHIALELGAEAGGMLFVPRGFAHGFCTLTDDAEVIYKVDDYYSPEHEKCVLWSDPALGITWPIDPGEATLSDRDANAPTLAALAALAAV